MIMVVFVFSYWIMLCVKIGWGDVWVCVIVMVLFFIVGCFLIGLYIGKIGVVSRFGVVGFIVVIFVWVYYLV